LAVTRQTGVALFLVVNQLGNLTDKGFKIGKVELTRGQVFILDKFRCNVKNEDLTPTFDPIMGDQESRADLTPFRLLQVFVIL
jgi:hypothetical protein